MAGSVRRIKPDEGFRFSQPCWLLYNVGAVGSAVPGSLESMSTRAVIFDVDGTLIDTNDLHTAAWVETFRHFGVEVDRDDVRREMGKGGDQLMPCFLPPDMVERMGRDIQRFRVDLFQRVYLPQARAFPGVRELFERIRGVLCGGFDADALYEVGCMAVYRD